MLMGFVNDFERRTAVGAGSRTQMIGLKLQILMMECAGFEHAHCSSENWDRLCRR